ncbi:amyloid-beta A4 precursor protein-binding family A member 1-like isoform X2 [Phalacrocorax aristotelis]|uniref:amyloid-beta A4 precursor protein-binding family A member 1-like isoform X2 n=1 Tax=Phalacrocorax aristotelis TaxID=126867 RepID=UPI003F4C3DF7
MNHLVILSEVEVNEEPANEDMNESVEADLEHSHVEEEQQSVICYSRHRNSNQGVPSGQEEEGMLAQSASTESDFHNHMDMVEGDVIATAEDGYDVDLIQENEDESTYAVQYRPESEEYTENAEAEHTKAVHNRTLPDHVHFHSIEHEEAMNAVYSGYVYAHQPLHQGEDERYAEPYAGYRQQEHVYEEIGDVLDLDVREGLQQYEWEREEADNYRKEALGARLHHYDERSDGESDSPEKEAEFALYPQMDSYEQEEDIDKIVAEVKQSMSSQSLGKAAEDMLEAEQSLEHAPGRGHESRGQLSAGSRATANSEETVQRCRKEKRDAISLAIKDIKEAIEEVKTRTVRSPYTPDEPKEPIWVMRQDISPTRDCDDQRPLHGDSLSPDSSSPWGAEPSRQHHQDICSTAETSTNKESRKSLASFPKYVEVPGPCDPEDLIDGIIFAANYLGFTQLLSDKTPSKNVRMMQAQEAVSRIKMAQKLAKGRKKALEGEFQPVTEVDLFISTQRTKVLNADTQETMMDYPLRTISYTADIGNIVVLMAHRQMLQSNSRDSVEASHPSQDGKRQYKMICHIFESEDAQLIAQSIGQAFSVAYQEFLRANGINPEDLSQKEYSDLLNTQDMYNDDLIHFSKSENCKDVYIEKQKGEILGVVIVESGWGSILPTVIIANMMHGGPAEKSGKLNIGDQIMSINGTSLVGLPLSTCQSIIKGLKNQAQVKLNVVRCPPVTTVLIRRPDLRYQLGFSVQNGIICSLMRGGIAERGGVRVGHRIIEINGQSVVATPHEKIVHILSNAVGEIHMKTMPAAMYRLLTAQEQPVYI